jgi:alpha-beta hydrolase superfamily lysophospholipase
MITASIGKTRAGFAIVFVLSVLVCMLPGCGGQALKPWHTERLKEEFTAEKADEVNDLAAYLALEDRLFNELNEKIYVNSETGPGHALDRYSTGSAADPANQSPNWNKSFELSTQQPRGAVLLLHGMSDSPYSLQAVGQALHREGYWVLGLRMPGHGTAPSGLRHVTSKDMLAAVSLSMHHLREQLQDKPVHIIGYSTGATLALEYTLDAIEADSASVPTSLVLISPAIGIHPAAGLASFKDALSEFPGLDNFAYLSIHKEFDPYKYNSFATNASDVVHRLTNSVARRIQVRAAKQPEKVLPPVLVLKSTVDATVSTQAVIDRLLIQLRPYRHKLILFDINRQAAVQSRLLIDDPGPLTNQVMRRDDLPFTITLVTNAIEETNVVVSQTKKPFANKVTETRELDLTWPRGVISLSHVALPFPPDDPLYGRTPPENDGDLFLGQMAIQGERGLLQLSPDWMLRLRYNPFYDYLEQVTIDWIDDTSSAAR